MIEHKLEGQVAQILNEKELVITIGAKDGVSEGFVFAVLAPPLEIRHPETNELLGTIDREKVRVKATVVKERMTICATFRAAQAVRRIAEVAQETLPAFHHAQKIPVEDSYVKLGDRVIRIESSNPLATLADLSKK